MFRLIRLIVLLCVIVGVVMGAYLWISRVPTLEHFLSQNFNTKVTIESVKIGLNKLTILGLKLNNPPPSTFPNAFQGKEITIEMNFLELLQKKIHINQVKIQDATLSLELYNYAGSDNNWSRLLLHNELHTQNAPTFIIDKLVLKNVQFNAIRATGKDISVAPLPYLELEKLGKNRPLTLSQIGQILFSTVLGTLTAKPSLGALLDNIATVPNTLLDGVTSSYSFEQTKKAMHRMVEVMQKTARKATDYIQNLSHRLQSAVPAGGFCKQLKAS